MLVIDSFIVDLRRGDDNFVEGNLFAQNLADSIWEYAMFLVSCHGKEREKILSWDLYVINVDGVIYNLLPNSDFDFCDLKRALKMLRVCKFNCETVLSTQNPLCTVLDICSFNQHQKINVFFSCKFVWNEEIEKNLKKIKMLFGSNENLKIIVVGDNGENELSNKIASLDLFPVVKLQNCDECFFQYFRTKAEDIFYPPLNDLLEISSDLIECQRTILTTPTTYVQSMEICTCHNLPIIKNNVSLCSVNNKKLKKSQINNKYSINNFIFPWKEPEFSVSKLVAQCRIQTQKLSESFIIGTTQLLHSSSSKFLRLINELRCQKEVILAKRIPSYALGGEFWILSADLYFPILHCKQIASRAQLVKFETCLEPSCDVYPYPILTNIPEVYEISPFLLGKKEICLSS